MAATMLLAIRTRLKGACQRLKHKSSKSLSAKAPDPSEFKIKPKLEPRDEPKVEIKLTPKFDPEVKIEVVAPGRQSRDLGFPAQPS